jgi:hypothetical protein
VHELAGELAQRKQRLDGGDAAARDHGPEPRLGALRHLDSPYGTIHPMSTNPQSMIPLPLNAPIWDAFFTVAPLVLVGTREDDGSHDLAPKHMALPLGWQNHFGFV